MPSLVDVGTPHVADHSCRLAYNVLSVLSLYILGRGSSLCYRRHRRARHV